MEEKSKWSTTMHVNTVIHTVSEYSAEQASFKVQHKEYTVQYYAKTYNKLKKGVFTKTQ